MFGHFLTSCMKRLIKLLLSRQKPDSTMREKLHQLNKQWKTDFAKICEKDLESCNLIKKRLQHKHFPVKFAKFLRTPFLHYREHL